MTSPELELDELYVLIGTQSGLPTDDQMAEIERLENIINPPKDEFIYRCPHCGSEFCKDEGQSWDCVAIAGGCPEDC